MSKLMTEYCGQYAPKKLCTIDRFGGADDCIECREYCEEYDCCCEDCAIQECFDRLADYEKIGELDEVAKVIRCKDCKHSESYNDTYWCRA